MKPALIALIAISAFALTALAQPIPPDTLWTNLLGLTFSDAGNCVQQTTDGGFIITGYQYTYICLKKTDSLGQEQWSRIFPDGSGYGVLQTNDGGYIVAGSKIIAGDNDVYLLKTDSLGFQQWDRNYGYMYNDYGYGIDKTDDGGYIIVGMYDSSSVGDDVYLIKTDSLGNQIWYRHYGGTYSQSGNSVQVTSDGGFIVVGTAWSSVTGLHDVYLIKTDSLGNLLWSNTYGGIYEDRGNSVRQTEDGGYIITGITYSFGGVGGDIYLIKTDSLGNQQWSRNFGTDEYDEGNCVKQTFDNGYVIVGKSRYYIPPSYDTYVTKVDSAGNQQWIFVFAGLGHDYGNWIEQLEDGSFIITGFGAPHGITYGDVLLFKLESETELLSISLSPVNPPITIPSVGGNFQFNGVVNNLGQGATVFDTWFNVSVPGITNPVNVLQRPNITLSVGGNLTRTLTQFVPGGAPAGTYIYRGFAGEFPNYVVDCDSFTFVKSP